MGAAAVTRADLGEALAALSRASRDLYAGTRLDPVLAELAEAAALGSGAEVAAVWLPQRGALSARAVWAVSAALAAELEGRTAASIEAAAELVRQRLDDGAVTLFVPVLAAGDGALVLSRRGRPFERDEESVPRLAADIA